MRTISSRNLLANFGGLESMCVKTVLVLVYEELCSPRVSNSDSNLLVDCDLAYLG